MKGNQGEQKRRGVIDFSSFLVVITTADFICFRVWMSNHWNQSHCVRSKYNKLVGFFSFSPCVTSCSCLALDVFSSSSSMLCGFLCLTHIAFFIHYYFHLCFSHHFFNYFMLLFLSFKHSHLPGSSCTKYPTVLFTFYHSYFLML